MIGPNWREYREDDGFRQIEGSVNCFNSTTGESTLGGPVTIKVKKVSIEKILYMSFIGGILGFSISGFSILVGYKITSLSYGTLMSGAGGALYGYVKGVEVQKRMRFVLPSSEEPRYGE